MPTVAIQGIKGSFHHQAAEQLLGRNIELISCDTFAEVFQVVTAGKAEYGVVAVENSLYGSINAVYRALASEKLWVSGEVFLKIEQCLIAAKPIELANIQKVISQAPALAQCEQWLAEHVPDATVEESHDTAASVQYITEHADEPLAAIAGRQAAELYGGTVIAGPVNDDVHNYTRFFLLTKEKVATPNADKTSIILRTNHQPGSLYNALGVFNAAEVNLSKLDSHPIAGDQWHYAFYIDFEVGADTEVGKQIIQELRAQGCEVTILGTYISGQLPL